MSSVLRTLFPPAIVVRERVTPGNALDLLPDETRYVARAVRKRIQEFAAGRVCARAALAEFGIRNFALHAAPDRQPVWPDGFVGSITHTADFCAAAVASSRSIAAIGLDSEIAGAPTPDIWPTICGEEELAWVQALPPGERPAAVTLMFSAKEAFYKCQSPLTGEWLDFHDVHVRVPGWGALQGCFTANATRQIRFARHASLPIAGRYVLHEPFLSAGVSIPAAGQ